MFQVPFWTHAHTLSTPLPMSTVEPHQSDWLFPSRTSVLLSSHKLGLVQSIIGLLPGSSVTVSLCCTVTLAAPNVPTLSPVSGLRWREQVFIKSWTFALSHNSVHYGYIAPCFHFQLHIWLIDFQFQCDRSHFWNVIWHCEHIPFFLFVLFSFPDDVLIWCTITFI
jgi:hypothetical protein